MSSALPAIRYHPGSGAALAFAGGVLLAGCAPSSDELAGWWGRLQAGEDWADVLDQMVRSVTLSETLAYAVPVGAGWSVAARGSATAAGDPAVPDADVVLCLDGRRGDDGGPGLPLAAGIVGAQRVRIGPVTVLHRGATPRPEGDAGGSTDGPAVLPWRAAEGSDATVARPVATPDPSDARPDPSGGPDVPPAPADPARLVGVLVVPDGRVPVDRDLVLGRAPYAVDAGDTRLVTLAGAGDDVSRSHVRLEVAGGRVCAVDLGSTNGTVVSLPGASAVRLRPHDPLPIVPGTVLELADDLAVRFEDR